MISIPFDDRKITMPHDSLACPDCGRLVEFRVGEDPVCECGKTLARILATEELPPSGPEVFLLDCPACGSKRQLSGNWIGKTDVCDCGQKCRLTLVLTKVPCEPDGIFGKGIRLGKRCWTNSLSFTHLEILPRLKRAWGYICDRIVPSIASFLSAACA